MTDANRPEENKEETLIEAAEGETEDAIGDETEGEAGAPIESEEEIEAAEDEAEEEAEDEPEDESQEDVEGDSGEEDASEEDGADVTDETAEEDQDEPSSDEPEFTPKPRPPAKLERLQKILAQSGVASRRKAEEMIEQGRVQVNGKTVTELGTKADAGRDHIRVDGKLLHGAERLRYFVLNKPRGFVTTVKDPEGRPTVMQFFEKMRERLYPVGRLDYLSEGLLLVTNDGDLANKLTRAAAGVEKTYLVKVSGIPSESELDVLRGGVAIEKGKPGSPKVRTSPARIRQVRQGDNPWYEVVLIEGRNRELRKMFEEIGHFVEKIRRVGYGPLILDQEPGNLRELDENELTLLRKAAAGTLRTPKAKEIRRRNMIDSLPPEKPVAKARGGRFAGDRPAAGPKDYQPKKSFEAKKTFEPRKAFGAGAAGKPAWKKDAPPEREAPRPSAGKSYGERPAARTFGSKPLAGRTLSVKPGSDKPGFKSGGKPAAGRTFGDKPAWKKPASGDRPAARRSGLDGPSRPRPEATRRPAPEPMDDDEPRKSFQLHIEPVQDFDRAEGKRPENLRGSGARSSRPSTGRSDSNRSGSNRSDSSRSDFNRSDFNRSGGGRSSSSRPFRPEGGSGRPEGGSSRPGGSPRPGGFARPGGLARPFTTSSGKPRPGGARPSSKPGGKSGTGAKSGGAGPRSFGSSAGRGSSATRGSGPAKRSFTPREGSGDFRPRSEGAAPERRTGTGWKPKPSFGGKPSGGSKPGYKGSSFKGTGSKGAGSKGAGSKSSSFKGKTGGKPGGKRPSGGKRSY